MNKKGFIATSLIYSFFLVFCATLASYVAINIHNKMLLNKVTDQIREDLNSTKYVTDMPVGSYVKFNVKYTKEGIDNKMATPTCGSTGNLCRTLPAPPPSPLWHTAFGAE